METQRGFRHEMNRHEAPSPITIRRWATQWREEGCVAWKKPSVGFCRPQSEATCSFVATEMKFGRPRSRQATLTWTTKETEGTLKDSQGDLRLGNFLKCGMLVEAK